MDLTNVNSNVPYIIDSVECEGETKKFLLTLGCYEEESITVLSKLSSNYIIGIKGARYSIDSNLAKKIKVKN